MSKHRPKHAMTHRRLQKTLTVSTAAVLLPVLGATGAHAQEAPAEQAPVAAQEQSEQAEAEQPEQAEASEQSEPVEQPSEPAEPAEPVEKAPAAPEQDADAASSARADQAVLAQAAVRGGAPAEAPKADAPTADAPKGSGGKTEKPGQGDDADIRVTCSGSTVTVTSSKDISNLVLVDSEGGTVKLERVNSTTATFERGNLVTVFVKSGSNASDGGPGFGEPFELDRCEVPGDEDEDGDETDGGETDGDETDGDETDGGNGDGGDTGQGDDAVITVTCEGNTVTVTSSKDISNIVFVDDQGNVVGRDELDDRTATFERGDLDKIFVKSGNNASGEGPGFGEEFLLAECTVEPVVETPVVETPDEETPAVETPDEETPVVETPGEETPVVETPDEQTPGQPVDQPADGGTDGPVDQPATPVQGETPAETPVEETPVVLDEVLVRTPAPAAVPGFTAPTTEVRGSVTPRVQVTATAVPTGVSPTTLPFTGAGTELIGLVALTSLAIGGGLLVAGRREQEA